MATMKRVVLQDGKVRYRVRVRVNGGYRSATRPNRAEARRWADRTERELRLNVLTPLGQSEVVTFGELVERYRRQVLRHKRLNSQRQQGQQLGWWLGFLGKDTPLVRITPPVISRAKDALAALSPKTFNRYLSALSHVFTRALKEWRCVEVNPCAAVGWLPEGEGRTRFLRPDERQRLLFACSTAPCRSLYTIVVVALSTGGRHEEVRRLRWDRVDLWRTLTMDGRTVEVGRALLEADQTKTGEARALILYGEALQLMRKLHRERQPGVPWCFPSPHEARFRPVDFRYSWERALDKARVENFCFHDLRHSAASYLGEQGASLAQIGAILGHKSTATTKKYTHFTSNGTEHLVARLGAGMFGGR